MTEPGWTLSLSNGSGVPLMIWLEPWAEELIVPPHEDLRLEIDGGDPDELAPEFEITDDGIVLYAASGTRLRALIGGVEQDTASRIITAPDLGVLPTRGFVDVVFGDFPEARPAGQPAPKSRVGWFRRLFGS